VNPTTRPKAIVWYQVYCSILAIMYLLVLLAGIILLLVPATTLEMEEFEKLITAGICILLGLPLAAASILPLLVKPRPWLWIYGIVLIATGFTSCCFWPICIPLLVFWIKPDVQRYFGKNV
jgi:hypothetical protein